MRGAQAPDVGPHRADRAVVALRHEVFRVDGVGEGHEGRVLLEARVDAFDLSADLVDGAVHLLAGAVVAEVCV